MEDAITIESPRTQRSKAYWPLAVMSWLLIPALVFTVLETGLRAANYGVCMRPFRVVNTQQGRFHFLNHDFLHGMFLQDLEVGRITEDLVIPEEKEPGTYRIFVFGSSAAQGWTHECSFAQLLHIMLIHRYPGVRFEVFNLARGGLNSSVMRGLAIYCARLQPDAFLIYMGNNEVVGPYGLAANNALSRGRVLTPLQIRLHQAARRLRTVQMFQRLLNKRVKEHQPTSMNLLRPDDPRLEHIWRNYQDNLCAIFSSAAKVGAPTFVSTLGANLRHWPPQTDILWDDKGGNNREQFNAAMNDGMQYEKNEEWQNALYCYDRAEDLNSSSPYLYFRQAVCLWALEDYDTSRRLFEKALELDSFSWVRAKDAFNQAVLRAVRECNSSHVILVDGKAAFEDVAPHRTPGLESFVDACHFRLSGMYVLAQAFMTQLTAYMPDWVAQHENKRLPEMDLDSILQVLGYSHTLSEEVLAHLLKRSEEYHLDSLQQLKTELFDIQANPAVRNPEEQIILLEKIIESGVEDVLLARKYVECAFILEEPMSEARLQTIGRLAQRYPCDLKIQHFYAQAAGLNAGDLQLARQVYERTLALYPDDSTTCLQLMDVFMRQKSLAEADKLVKHAQLNLVDENILHCLQGDVHYLRGVSQAMMFYMKALRKPSPAYPRALEGLRLCILQFSDATNAHGEEIQALVQSLVTVHQDTALGSLCAALGAHYERQNDYDRAIQAYQCALDIAPADQTPQLIIGALHEKQGHMDEALEAYRGVLLKNPECPLTAEKANNLLVAHYDTSKSVSWWRDLAMQHPESAIPGYYVAVNLERSGEPGRALESYEALLKNNPEHWEARFRFGMLKIRAGETEVGLAAIHRAATSHDARVNDIGNACTDLGAWLQEQGKLEDAERVFAAALKISPNNLWPLLQRAEISEKQGNVTGALKVYSLILLSNPESPLPAANADALLTAHLGVYDSLAWWHKVVSHHPECVIPRYYYGRILERAEDLESAFDVYQSLLEKDPEHWEARTRLGALKIKAGETDEGLAALHRAAASHDARANDIGQVCTELGSWLLEQDKKEDAGRVFAAALEISPTDLLPLVYLAEMMEDQGDVTGALEAYSQILLSNPESPLPAANADALLTAHLGVYDSLAWWHKVVSHHPECVIPRYYYGRILERAEDYESAYEVYQSLLKQNPQHWEARCRLGALQIMAGELEAGLAEVVKASHLPGAEAGKISMLGVEVAAGFMANEEYDSAERLYRAALDISPEDLWPLVYLGELHEQKGDTDAALECYRILLMQKPESPVTAQKMYDLHLAAHTPIESMLAQWKSIVKEHPDAKVPTEYLNRILAKMGEQ